METVLGHWGVSIHLVSADSGGNGGDDRADDDGGDGGGGGDATGGELYGKAVVSGWNKVHSL